MVNTIMHHRDKHQWGKDGLDIDIDIDRYFYRERKGLFLSLLKKREMKHRLLWENIQSAKILLLFVVSL